MMRTIDVTSNVASGNILIAEAEALVGLRAEEGMKMAVDVPMVGEDMTGSTHRRWTEGASLNINLDLILATKGVSRMPII